MLIFYFAIELYNKYIKLLGGTIGLGARIVRQDNTRLHTIEDDLPLIHFLSETEV